MSGPRPIGEAVRHVVRRAGEVYLCGGVWAQFDGDQVWIRADRDGMSHEIALEAQTIERLNEYISGLIKNRGNDGGS